MTNAKSDYRTRFGVSSGKKLDLSKIDPDDNGEFDGKDAVAKRIDECRSRMQELQTMLYAEHKRAVLVCLQGMDSAGKDGVINHVFSAINQMGCRVTSFKQPTPLERAHDFLWRHHLAVPEAGIVALFNRSHYEAVVVERVDKIIDKATCKRRFDEINDFERMLASAGTTVVKLFLHISKDEQLARFKARLDDPLKVWKIGLDDFEQRAKWDDNLAAYEDAITNTSTATAPWYIVPSNRKWYRDLVISEIMTETFENMELALPTPPPDMAELRKRYDAEQRATKAGGGTN
ncbi:MAG: PPK2 family polyphosphate kinase [Hyphomicrobium aestuarii]|nr:PPK2 family polyphosphate kinase [Hyphomicrobium aestuarii]